MIALVDTHCHLVLLEERGLLQQALEGAAEAGVEQVVSIGLDVEDSERNRRIAESRPGVLFSVGWHPHQPASPDGPQLAALRELLTHPRAVAVGEVGLDAYWRPGYHETPMEVQLRSLRMMLELAAESAKPVVVHDRDAHEEVMAEISRWVGSDDGRGGLRRPRGVLHCFSGTTDLARRAASLGMVCSFAGTVTFPGSAPIREAARAVADDGYVLETDAPFLAPVPHRGRPNLPGYVAATAAAVAELRGQPLERVAAATTANARRLFALPDPSGDRLGGG